MPSPTTATMAGIGDFHKRIARSVGPHALEVLRNARAAQLATTALTRIWLNPGVGGERLAQFHAAAGQAEMADHPDC